MGKVAPKFVKIIHTNYLRSGFGEQDITEEQYVAAEIQYDANGNILKEFHFAADGAIESEVKSSFDDANRAVQSAQYDENGELCQKNVFAYDEAGNLVRKGCYYGEDSPEYATVYVYENNQLVREDSYVETTFDFTEKTYTHNSTDHSTITTEFDEDGNILYRTTDKFSDNNLLISSLREEVQQHDSRYLCFEYDENGRKMKELLYNFDRKLIAKTYYQRDEKGNVTEMEEENLDTYRLTQYVYEGVNCAKIMQLDKEKTIQSDTIYLYNANGDVVHMESHIRDEVNPEVLRIATAIDYEIEY